MIMFEEKIAFERSDYVSFTGVQTILSSTDLFEYFLGLPV